MTSSISWNVVLDRVLPRLGSDRLVQLAETQPLEGRGLDAERAFTEGSNELGCSREQQIAGEDRHRVAPHRLRARHAAAHLRFVHDVVVVERREVGDLDRLRRDEHILVCSRAELSGEQRQHRAHPLAAGIQQVTRRDVGDLVGEPHLLGELPLDDLETFLDVGDELPLLTRREQLLAEPQRGAEGLAPAGEGGARVHGGPICRSVGRQGRVSRRRAYVNGRSAGPSPLESPGLLVCDRGAGRRHPR
jgi:hypothetical protein